MNELCPAYIENYLYKPNYTQTAPVYIKVCCNTVIVSVYHAFIS